MRLLQERIIGIDPGTNILGFGIIEVKDSQAIVLDVNVIKLKEFEQHTDKLKEIFLKIQEIIETYCPATMSIETPFYGKNPQSMLKLGRAQGVALTAGMVMGLKLYEYSPKKIKQSITGNGNASKEQVAKMLESILNYKIKVKYLDATDGLAAALCCHYQMSSKIDESERFGGWESFIRKNPHKVK